MYDYDALWWLVWSCIVVRFSYEAVDKLLVQYSDKYLTLPVERRMYIQKNLVKSSCLAVLTTLALWWVVWPIVQYSVWDNYTIHRLAAIYVSNDIVGLICVDKLPKTTRVHHIITSTLVIVSLGLDFGSSDIAQAMLVYTLASATAYMVNFHLGVRWLCARDTLRGLRHSAAAIYVTCCALSWTWHIHWLWSTSRLNIFHAIYVFLLIWVVRDDIILMRWLTT